MLALLATASINSAFVIVHLNERPCIKDDELLSWGKTKSNHFQS
jgi:hypothetical protein